MSSRTYDYPLDAAIRQVERDLARYRAARPLRLVFFGPAFGAFGALGLLAADGLERAGRPVVAPTLLDALGLLVLTAVLTALLRRIGAARDRANAARIRAAQRRLEGFQARLDAGETALQVRVFDADD